jgi:hypothetical protein
MVNERLGVPEAWQCDAFELECRRPIVFIFDEYHHDVNSTSDNLELAASLIARHSLTLIGVEGYPSPYDPCDESVDPSYARWSPARFPRRQSLATDVQFAEGIRANNVPIVGVENENLFCQLGADIDRIDDDPINIHRSESFVLSLFWERKERTLDGDLMLNCGSNHGYHIMAIARGALARPTEWPVASFVRLRGPRFPVRAR